MAFEQPIEGEEIEVSWGRSYFWGFWKTDLYVKGLYGVVQKVIKELKEKKK